MADSNIPPTRLRQVRDMVLRYVYENGVTTPGWFVSVEKIKQDLPITSDELSSASMVIYNQGLFSRDIPVDTLGLNQAGQREAESLGPSVLMREPTTPSIMEINANYSVVQVAGANSTQSANLSIDQSQLLTILEKIERDLPSLELDVHQQEEASGLVEALKKATVEKFQAAAGRALGGALCSILTGAGSKYGQSLADALGISIG